MSSERWTPDSISDQTGRVAVVTGANSGIGFFTALELARHGAEVVMAVRDPAKGGDARQRLLAEVPGGRVEVAALDLASLDSVRSFSAGLSGRRIDLLINNAGVMAPPQRRQTVDGFELQFGTNVLGHFALTMHFLPQMRGVGSRVVTVSSIAHKRGRLRFDDLQSLKQYSPMGAYQQSKLADLMFAFELERRLRASDSEVVSVAAHPGVAETSLFVSAEHAGFERRLRKGVGTLIGVLLNSQAEGAYPTLYAATSASAEGGGYYGPQGFAEMRGGDAGPAKVAAQAREAADAERLWEVCELLTGLGFTGRKP